MFVCSHVFFSEDKRVHPTQQLSPSSVSPPLRLPAVVSVSARLPLAGPHLFVVRSFGPFMGRWPGHVGVLSACDRACTLIQALLCCPRSAPPAALCLFALSLPVINTAKAVATNLAVRLENSKKTHFFRRK